MGCDGRSPRKSIFLVLQASLSKNLGRDIDSRMGDAPVFGARPCSVAMYQTPRSASADHRPTWPGASLVPGQIIAVRDSPRLQPGSIRLIPPAWFFRCPYIGMPRRHGNRPDPDSAVACIDAGPAQYPSTRTKRIQLHCSDATGRCRRPDEAYLSLRACSYSVQPDSNRSSRARRFAAVTEGSMGAAEFRVRLSESGALL